MSKYIEEGFIVKNNEGQDEVIHIPYNLNNILINNNDIIQILKKCNVKINKINHIEYFQIAFTHKSYCKKDIYPPHILELVKEELNNNNLLELRDESYERLEYLGDRVIKLIVSNYLFFRYPKQNEGFMTKLQTKIEDKKNLATMSKELGLDKFFIISKQIENINGRYLDKIHEDIFEAFIGALYLSNGYEVCVYALTNLLETLIDYSEKLYCDNNYKDILLRFHHQKKWPSPQYATLYHKGPPHKRKYIMAVEKHDANRNTPIEEKFFGFGIGNSKKEGEQYAAKMALILLGMLEKDQYNTTDIFYPSLNEPIQNNSDSESNFSNISEKKNNNKTIINKKNIKNNDDSESIYSNLSDKSLT